MNETRRQWHNDGWRLRSRPNVDVILSKALKSFVATQLVGIMLFIGLGIWPGVARARTEAESPPLPHETIVFALASEPTNLNSIFLDINAGNWKMFNGVIKFDQNLRPVPDLARDLPTVSADGKTITVHLRPDVRFHDGHSLTADDVVFTWQVILDPQVLTPVRSALALSDLITGVRAIDKHTVEFSLSRPDPAFIEKLYVGIAPRHLLADEDLNTTRFNRAPVGTGPYVFKEWTPGNRIVLEANPDYFAGSVGIKRIVYIFVEDENTRAGMLSNGTIDVTRLSPQLATGFSRDDRFRVIVPPTASISQVSLPNDNPVLADSRVRRALSMAVDRQMLVDTVWHGMARVAYGPILSEHWAYDDSAYIPYDPAEAKELLRDAGWTQGADGFFVKDGQRLAFTLMYLPNLEHDRLLALALRSYFANIGVDVQIEGVASPAYLDRLHEDAWLHGIGLPYDPDYVLWSAYHSNFARDGDPTTNRARMRNAEVDAALEAGRQTSDPESRREAYIAVQRGLREDGSYLFLTQRGISVVLSNRIQGVVPKMMGSPHAFIRGISWNVEDWSLNL